MKRQHKAYVFASLAVLFWSTVATAFKLALKEYDIFQLLFISSATATLSLLLILLFQKKKIHIQKRYIPVLLAGGLLNPFLYYFILFKAYSLLPAQIAQSLNYTWPVVLSVFSAVYFRQKVNRKTLVSLLLGFAGVVIISFKGKFELPQDISIPGIVLALASSLVWAVYWIISTSSKTDPVVTLFIHFAGGFLWVMISLLLFSDFPHWDRVSFPAAVYTGLFEMGITFVLWHSALRHSSSAAKVSNLVYLSPFLSLFIINTVLGETILPSTVLGLSIIIGGILLDKLTEQKPGF